MTPDSAAEARHEFKFVAVHTVVDNEFCFFDIDEYDRGGEQFLMAHVFFRKVTADALRHCLHTWRLFRQCVTAPLYAVRGQGSDERLWKHFVSLFGFVPTPIFIPSDNGVPRQLFISTVTHDHLTADPATAVVHDPVGTAGCAVN